MLYIAVNDNSKHMIELQGHRNRDGFSCSSSRPKNGKVVGSTTTLLKKLRVGEFTRHALNFI
jgi:hypothetical protein